MSGFEEEVLARLDRIEAALKGGSRAPAPPAPGVAAPASDLDSKWGDPEVRYDPKRWRGESYKGRRYSECPADYLLELAGFLDWMAGKDEEEGGAEKLKYAGYKRKDAARARGWAARVANLPPRKLNDLFGGTTQEDVDPDPFNGIETAGEPDPAADDIPF